MISFGKTFKEVVDHVKNVEGVKQEFYAKLLDKKVRKGGRFSGLYSEGPIPQGYSRRHIWSAI